MEIKNNKIYLGDICVEELAKEYGTPLYVYEKETFTKKINFFKNSFKEIEKLKIYYAIKSNNNLHLLKILKDNNIGINAISIEEAITALKAGFSKEEIFFTGANLTKEEIKFLIQNGIKLNIDSLSDFEKIYEVIKELKIKDKIKANITINPEIKTNGVPENLNVGPTYKLGISQNDIPLAIKLSKKYGIIIDSAHAHIGSGITDVDLYLLSFNIVLDTISQIPKLKQINVGSGFGIKYSPKDKTLDFELLAKEINGVWKEFCEDYDDTPVLSFEPGRILIAEAGFLLAEVTSIKTTSLYKFIGVNTGFNHLIRPMAFGSYHPIYNGSNVGEKGTIESVVVTGNICESKDIFTLENGKPSPRDLPSFKLGDIIVFALTGAYGYSMSNNYNLRPRPAEVLVEKGQSFLIRKRETIDDLLRNN